MSARNANGVWRGGGGQNGIEDLINYGTFSTQKYEVRQVYQHTKGGDPGLPVMHGGYWW